MSAPTSHVSRLPRALRTSLRSAAWALAAAAALLGPASRVHAQQAGGQPQALPTINLSAGMYNIKAQVAQTEREREIGLMFRKTMPDHEGMLFVFDEPGQQCFWMKNTLLPLSVAFLADDGTVVNVDEMQPQTLNSHCSAKPVRYVLEMNKGWFAKRAVKAGAKLGGAPFGGGH